MHYMTDTKTERSQKVTVQDIVDGVVKLIRNGTYLPGTPLREAELCRLFGVSRTPVREALRLLQNNGVVEYIPRCGVQVADITRQTLRNLTETRTVLEVLSTRQAAERITPQELAELRQINEQLRTGTDGAADRLDALFHRRIAEISANPCTIQFLDNLLMRLSIVAHAFYMRPRRIPLAYEEHEGILRALELHDPELAAKQADIHFHMSQASLQGKLELYLENKTEEP